MAYSNNPFVFFLALYDETISYYLACVHKPHDVLGSNSRAINNSNENLSFLVTPNTKENHSTFGWFKRVTPNEYKES